MAVLRYALPCAAAIGLAGLTTLAGAQTDVIGTVRDDPSVVRSSFYLPVRDGTRLAVNVYRPADGGKARAGRFPVVFAFTPYRARYRKDGELVDLIDSTTFGLRDLVHEGYVVATADVRGKGASFGARRGFLDQTEAHDGNDIVQWLAARPYTTGKVGITGCSYLGGSAMLVAGALPPALKAVFAAATDIDKYAFVRNGGITAQFNTRPDEPLDVDLASVPVDADRDGALLREAVADHVRNTPMAPLWAGMPYRDSVSPLTGNRYWEEVGPYTHLKALQSPQLAWYLWGNWNDEPTEQIIQAAANLDAKLIVGPGSHCEPPKVFDIVGEQKRFFDRYLKDVDNGIDREPRYSWWQERQGGGTLVHRARLPGTGIGRTAIYLTAAANDTPAAVDSGSLALRAGTAAPRPFRVDYDVATKDYFQFWPSPLDGKGLTFTSRPLAADAAIEGFPILTVRAAIDRPDGNVFGYLESVDPTGKVTMLAFGRLAMSHRKTGVAPYNHLDLPYHSGLRADVAPATPGRAETLTFALSPRAYTIPAGHRLRVTITGADPRQRNLPAIRDALARTVTLTTGAASHIDIPFTAPVRFR
ncbi:CocE/NonD family hydrolase [Sphingomonas sp. RIT328]|uniref:CocE/NonD family hydrolase n=1 Tax=Sphingomonas sp. RIT328 TaxID=1470591 RepID=UPI0004457D64|nr:CocE/NonD family hydrolase [Sphingomonas sp. RIT328]EZP52564.1 Peptidase S15 precursor [Sphingomonas sp. RIT328]